MLESVASQAAITIQNVRYIREIKELFRSFVRVMSSAVDERTPYNGSHTRHMAQYGDRFIDFLNARGEGMAFSPAQKDELLMSVWLHDIGKLVIPLEVMNKMARLLPEQYTALIHRMEVIRLQVEIDCLAGRISQEEKEVRIQETFRTVELVDSINGTGFVTDEKLAELDNLREKHWTDGKGELQPWMTAEEYAMLSIRRGTLSQKEREIMEEEQGWLCRLSQFMGHMKLFANESKENQD